MVKKYFMKKKSGTLDKYIKLFTQGDKKIKLIFFLGIAGILLIFLSTVWNSPPKDTNKNNVSVNMKTIEEHTRVLEENLLNLLENIEGVGKTQVLITLESGIEYVYVNVEKKSADDTIDYDGDEAKKRASRKSNENSIVIIDGKEGKQALVKTELEPSVKGIVVVCEGGDNLLVIERVTKAVTTAMGIGANRVCITKLDVR